MTEVWAFLDPFWQALARFRQVQSWRGAGFIALVVSIIIARHLRHVRGREPSHAA